MAFGTKTAQEMQAQVMQPSRIPTDKVMTMRAQGLSNNQIIQVLQRDGFELTAIFNALNQADLKGGIDATAGIMPDQDSFAQQMPEVGGTMMPQQSTQQMPGMQQQFPPMQQSPQQGMQQPMGYGEQMPMIQDTGMMQDMSQDAGQPDMEQQPMDMSQQMPPMGYQQPAFGGGFPQGPSFETQRIEELAEAIIDEKWNEIVRSINKIVDWKERVETRLTKLEQQVDDMNKNFDTLHKGVLGKISDYDRNLTNVGAEIKAMDKVFQKVLPSLTESVGELSRITTTMKKK